MTPPLPALGRIDDANILTPFDAEDPRYRQPITIANGARITRKTTWHRKDTTVGEFALDLCRHQRQARKDGRAFVGGELIGKDRQGVAVKAIHAVGLDIDVGVPLAQIDAAVADLNCLAIRYTTHSHGKPVSHFVKSTVQNKMRVDDVTPDVIREYLRREKRWVESLLDSLEYVGDEHLPTGVCVVLHHDPMPKCRVILPLLEPFIPGVVANSHADGLALWRAVPVALAQRLGLELALDRSALDAARAFYWPSHPGGGAHDTAIYGGDLLDWRSFDLTAARAALESMVGAVGVGGRKTKTPDGQALGKWARDYAEGFQIADLVRDYCDDRIRTHGALKLSIECPWDENHSNAGDPNDKGCFVANAGDSSSPIFTIKCLHDGCAGLTGLDHLAKMLRDGWFDRSLITDDAYCPEVSDPEPDVPQEAAETVVKLEAGDGAADPAAGATGRPRPSRAQVKAARTLLRKLACKVFRIDINASADRLIEAFRAGRGDPNGALNGDQARREVESAREWMKAQLE